MVLDARDSFTQMTLGELFDHHLQQVNQCEEARKALTVLNGTFCSFYEVMEVDARGPRLRDIASQREHECWSSSGYAGRKGEIWYVRVAPPFVEGSGRSVTLGTPYVFRDSSREVWESFFQRYLASEKGGDRLLQDYLKNGKSLGYWLEFIFQAIAGYTGNMILVTGVPDNPASLPHYYPDSGIDDTLGGPFARRRCCSLGQRPLPPSHPLLRRDKLARQGGHLSSLTPSRQPKFSANLCRLSR